MLIIVNINVNNLDLDSVIQCLYLINNLRESLINLYTIYIYKLPLLCGEIRALLNQNVMSARSWLKCVS